MSELDQRPIVAAIDIGSNSIKMTVARPDGNGGIEQIDWASDVVRLGQGVEETGVLDNERVEAAIETLARFADRARAHGATSLVAVATEATRAAKNGVAFLERVKQETGIDVRAISGEEEAALTFRGLSATLSADGEAVIADIGGGSTELIVVREGELKTVTSIPLGSGRLTEKHIQSDPPRAEELAASENDAQAALRGGTQTAPLPSVSGSRLIVVGGTGEFMARLVPDENAIDFQAVRNALAKMEVLTAAELADAIDAPEARARVLPAGVTIVTAIASLLQPKKIEISRGGVRAGLLIEAFADANREARVGDAAITPPPEESVKEKRAARGRPASRHEKARSVPSNGDFRATMKRLIAQRWRAVWEAIPVAIEGSDIEGVHDVRVASRRLRAAMDIAAPIFPQPWFKPLHQEAKRITRALGEVRDRDVLLEALRADRDAAQLTERPGIDRLIERIERERLIARADMERYLEQLMRGPIAREVERRFGPEAAARQPTGVAEQ